MLDLLRRQLARNYQHPFYRKKFDEANVKPEDIRTLEDFQRLPFTTREDLQAAFESDPFGGFMIEDVVRINLSPSGKGLMPVLQTKNDVEAIDTANAQAFARAGVDRLDIALITFNYHIFIAGLNFHGGMEKLGAKAVPLGPGSTERALEIAEIVKPTVLISNPSFALKLAKEGLEGIKVLIAAGEPFSSVEGYKDEVKEAFGGATMIDYYGMAECLPIACECKYENGLHVVDEFCYVEIIDPDTGEVLEEGERGEVVITHLNKEAMPMQRFRTGDLSMIERFECECGKTVTMPKGVFGRTDEMYKVKGVKFYPSQLNLVLKGFPQLTGRFRAVIKRTEKGTDYLEIQVEGSGDVDHKKLEEAVRSALLISPNEIRVVDRLEKDREVLDLRY
jgi:phenylacetate-CoA ligase